MRCPRCGQENAAGSQFCRHCGRKLPKSAVKPAKKGRGAAKKTAEPNAKAPRQFRWGRAVGLAIAAMAVLGIAGAGYETLKALHSMPPVGNLVSLTTAGQDSVVYDRFGKPVATLHLSTNRIDVPLKDVSPNMQNALVATEDHNFWKNDGFDLRSIFRAAYVDLLHRGSLQGASTITEQLAKMLYLHDNRSITYKIQEIILGLELARSYSKQQILDMYLNQVYLGDGAYGIATASKAYFNESPSQLTIPQAAVLAGLPQAPSLYDPITNYKLAKARQLEVLQEMAKYGYIKPSQVKTYYDAPLHLSPQKITTAGQATPFPYPWYIQHVIHVLEKKGFTQQEIYNGGLKIYTKLDPTVYNIAQNAVDHWMNYNFGSNPDYQAATMVENPKTGAVWAVIGGRTYSTAFGQDLATSKQALRSSGSSIKPLMEYTEAIMQGYTQLSVINDVPTVKVNGQWWPRNDDGIYRGYIDLRDALAISDNDASVHLLEQIGLQNGYNFATQKFGISTLPAVDAQSAGIAIGGFAQGGVNVQEMTRAYATFPNGGTRMKQIWVSKVVDANGSVVYSQKPQGTTIFSPQVAYIMDKMMERVLYPGELPGIGPGAYPTGVQLGIGRPAAGKTGTNNGERDAWFMGYEPQMVVGVWEGNKMGEYRQPSTPNGLAYGDVAAGPIWKQIMEQVNQAEHIPVEHFKRPSGVTYVSNVSITSGKLASALTPKNEIEGAWFINGTQPTTTGHTHVRLKVLASNPKVLWQPGCGPAISQVFLIPPPNWKAPEPKPWSYTQWPPTQKCTPGSSPSGNSSSSSSHSSHSSSSSPPSRSTSSPPSSQSPSSPPPGTTLPSSPPSSSDSPSGGPSPGNGGPGNGGPGGPNG
ncbi:transglycosylase domain-containing protein [Sulfobacillus harzensis]|uniref:Penicillin-binding protein 1A n=1 Tax=Sulfobacillus harzensis TaxID=2729629 RepID=A0A7Y0L457_9FIRM|nr:transglycosylase domain-containing protein [Sulfobacillus harzensis]NMP22973.1 zinc-ribbon domain-containing protein [Sulfobacillus harzensis]